MKKLILKFFFKNKKLKPKKSEEFFEEEKEYINVEFFMKPWLYNFNFTFNNKENPYYSKRDCYKEATGKCLLDLENYTRGCNNEIYDYCRGLKHYLKTSPKGDTIPFISTDDGKNFSVSDGQHRLCVAIKEKIPYYVSAEIPKEELRKIKEVNQTEVEIQEY